MGKDGDMKIKIQKFASKIQKNRYVNSISDGLASALPVILGGAIFTLIDTINIPAYQNFLESTNLKALTGIPPAITIELLSLYAVFSIAFNTAKQFKSDGFSSGIVALMSFLIVTPIGILNDDATMALSFQWLGATGLFVAIIIGVFTGRLIPIILEKGLYIKMPKGVLPTIEKSFAALTPAFTAIFIMLVIRGIFEATRFGNVHEFIYSILQVPLTNLGSSWWAYLIIIAAMSVLWFFGIHGTIVVMSVIMPIWASLGLENLAAFRAGEPLPHMIPGGSFFMVYTALGGTGATIGLSLVLLFAKSKRYKVLGKLAIIPGITGINEPVMFGIPIVLNMKLLIPLIVSPIIVSVIAIVATFTGIVPPLRGIGLPLGTPLLVNGFLEGGVRVAILQAVLVVVSVVMYYPFLRSLDRDALRLESESNHSTSSDSASVS